MPGNGSRQSHTQNTFNTKSFNVERLSTAKQQLVADLGSKHQCAVICMQETHRGQNDIRPNVPGTPRAVLQCHICDVANRGQQHRDPESRSAWNLSDIGPQTTRWTFLVPPATDCGRRLTSCDQWGLQQPQFDMGLCYDVPRSQHRPIGVQVNASYHRENSTFPATIQPEEDKRGPVRIIPARYSRGQHPRHSRMLWPVRERPTESRPKEHPSWV